MLCRIADTMYCLIIQKPDELDFSVKISRQARYSIKHGFPRMVVAPDFGLMNEILCLIKTPLPGY